MKKITGLIEGTEERYVLGRKKRREDGCSK